MQLTLLNGSSTPGIIQTGDRVTLDANEQVVKQALTDVNYGWNELMRPMLGQTFTVAQPAHGRDWERFKAGLVALPSPDGSQNGLWYFPTSVLSKEGACVHN